MKKYLIFVLLLSPVVYLNCTRTCYVLAVPQGTTSANYTGYQKLPGTYEKSWWAGDCNHNDAGAQQIAKNNGMIAVDACWIHSLSCPEAGAIMSVLESASYV